MGLSGLGLARLSSPWPMGGEPGQPGGAGAPPSGCVGVGGGAYLGQVGSLSSSAGEAEEGISSL